MIRRFSVPFSLTLLALLGLIVAPLAGVLVWLGAETAATLEHRNVHQRMTALSGAVEGFLRNGLQQIVLMGGTLADTPGFQPLPGEAVGTPAGDAADAARLDQLFGLLGRHSLVAAAFVGYADGHFLYAGRADTLSDEQRGAYGAAADGTIILRRIDGTAGNDADRRETWWLRTPDGRVSAPRSRANDYDPRRRPWYVEAQASGRAVLTEPYVFANADVVGISAGIPLPNAGGVFGYDITLDTLSTLIAAYKITPNSVIMVGSLTGGAVVGNVGTRDRINYTLVGPVANQASRLEGLNKVYGTDVLASGEVMRRVADRFVWRMVDRAVAAGTTEPHELHEPLALRTAGEASAHAAFLETWDAARADYVGGRFNEALQGFRAALAIRPQDGPCRIFIARCTAFAAEGGPAGWDGTWHFDHK